MHYIDVKLQLIVMPMIAQSQQLNMTPDSIFFVWVPFEITLEMEKNSPSHTSFQRDYSITMSSGSIYITREKSTGPGL